MVQKNPMQLKILRQRGKTRKSNRQRNNMNENRKVRGNVICDSNKTPVCSLFGREMGKTENLDAITRS